MKKFTDFELLPSIHDTLKEMNLADTTEIQSQIIPIMLSGRSVVGVSETGSGKTLSYVLPVLHYLKNLETKGFAIKNPSSPRALVMVPTRELGEQVGKVFKAFTHKTRLRVRIALGGMTFEQSRRNVAAPFEVLISTPGRILKLLEKDLLSLADVRMLIFDEADQMMDQGFLQDTNFIVEKCPDDIQLSLFSATVSNSVQKLMNELFKDAEVIRTTQSGKIVVSLTTQNLMVADGKRWPLFEKVLKQKSEGGTIIFTNTRDQCDKLAKELTDKGYKCVTYRGDMEHADRRKNLKKFREGQVELLVATDLAGRGLDIPLVGRVINYHLPKQMENYLHRAGRTARAGRKGLVINMVTERDQDLISRLETSDELSLEQKALGHQPKAKSVTKFDPRERRRQKQIAKSQAAKKNDNTWKK